eukprot:TRINITY_DN1129_c1_g1_i1.p1 TRINITY_DN1129_c1_g1~~TRINITY_DN1129_c1_g1_i1.p1  ORF type:complete len:420 (+),score=78.74 TRINITY_DN1129_c1_g1_i1:191-1450(+)
METASERGEGSSPCSSSSPSSSVSPKWVLMNAAGASPVAAATHSAIVTHLELERTVGGYSAADMSPSRAHDAIASLLGCDEDEVAVLDSAQAAWARAFYSLTFRAGDRILCFESEYSGNAIAFLQAAKHTGVTVEVLAMRTDGIVDIDALAKALGNRRPESRQVVALTHIQTDSSVVQPAEAVGQLCADNEALFLLDACQSIGQMAVDVRRLGCDFATGTGRKWLRGPRGTGFLYVRRGILRGGDDGGDGDGAEGVLSLVGEPPLLDHFGAKWITPQTYTIRPDARRFEMLEASEALRHGLASAASLCLEAGPASIFKRATSLATRLRAGLTNIPGCRLRDAPESFDDATAARLGASRCAIVIFEAETTLGIPAVAVRDALRARHIDVSVSPGSHHFGVAARTRPAAVRLSPKDRKSVV